MRRTSSRLTLVAALGAVLVVCAASTVSADLSAFVGSVRFDDDAGLDNSLGLGVRWGKSSGIFGGETSLMLARPERTAAGESVTAIFYEGRILVNIPLGAVMPFVGVGFGAITTTSADIPQDATPGAAEALQAISDLQTNSAFSYGGGVRYALNDRMDARVDIRQYQVLSVKTLVATQIAEQAGVGDLVPKEKTVQHNELSLGVVFRF